jgi:rhodanese-related sulfurtransferase
MSEVKRIDATQAYQKSRDGDAVLVCAYDDEQLCEDLRIADSLTLGEFEVMRSSIPKHRQIIFYCTSPEEATSARRAEDFRNEFGNSYALLGGVHAWRQAGHPMATETAAAVEQP